MLHSTSSEVKTALSGLYRTKTGLHELHRVSTVGKSAFDHSWHVNRIACASQHLLAAMPGLSGHSRIYTGLHELHRTFTVVKTAFSIFPDTSASLQVLHSTSSPVKSAFSDHSSTYTGLHELHRTSTVVKTAF